MLVSNTRGNYRFLKGISAYSSGVTADPGYEIVHAVLAVPVSVRAGFDLIAQHLSNAGRPLQSLCAIELRSPRPLPFDGFAEFNASYSAILAGADLLVDGLNPIARTNIAPEVNPPSEPVLYGFSYTVRASGQDPLPAFVVAGAGELSRDRYDVQHIIRAGETNDGAMREKARCVLDLLSQRLSGLEASWEQVNVVNVYTIRDICPFLRDEILGIGAAAQHGVRWHYARPPIEGLEFEMDVRAESRAFSQMPLQLGS